MSLVIETGAGLPNAESYASVAQADARCVALGVTDWAARATTDKEVALRLATQFMLANYRTQWSGRRVYRTQALDWPRYGVTVDEFPIPSDEIPVEVINACIDLAVRSAGGTELLPDMETGSNAVKKDKIGPLETEYFENTTSAADRFVAIDAALAPFFGATGGSGMIRVIRG